MAYWTTFALSTYDTELSVTDVLSFILQQDDEMCGYLDYVLGVDGCSDATTWRTHVEDVLKLSLLYPNVGFKLHGEGEQDGDVWDKYFKNGIWSDMLI